MEFVVILGLFHRPVSAESSESSDTGKLQGGNSRKIRDHPLIT